MAIGPNCEDVDRFLDGQDLAVRHEEEHELMCSTGAMKYLRCSVCGDKVGRIIRGICDQCRGLEGSVWRQDWGG